MQDFPERLTALEPFWGLWRLDAFIGKGSYGKVYRIKREEFGETYYAALKWISLPQNQSEIQSLRNEGYDDASIADHYASVIKAFQSEIVLMSKLRGHSHIVSFEDHLFEKRENELGWDILIRMELLESLPGFFRKERAVRDVVTLGCDICDALTLCAKYKIVHRDIKPDNIFVNENGDFKLGDFGVARQMEHTQTNMSRKGTPFFMAPEVYMGREADARADQYSLGLVMHRLLNAQQIPFAPAFDRILTHQEREEALLQRLRGEALPPPLQGSEKLKQIVLKASNYQPKKRFAAPEEMKAALQQTLNERENQAALFKAASGQISSKRSSLKPDVAPGRGRKPNKKKKDKTGWVLGILTGLILLLAGAGVWLLIQAPDEGVPASFENTIPAVQTPVPSTARTPMPTATPVPIDPIETLTAVLTSAPTTAPTVTLTATPTDTPTIVPTFTPTSAPTVTPTPAPTPAEESLASEYTYHFDGTRYTPKSGTISAFTGLIAQEIPDIDKLIMEDSAAGLLSTDYNYDWQLSAEIAAVLDSSFEIEKEDRWCQMVFWQEDADTALGLIGKTVFTLTISKKSDNTVLTKVNCILDSLLYSIEWENDEYIEQEIVFTPGQSLTITLPQDKIAYTHDGTTVIYDWLQSTDKVSYYELVSGADCTSVTFTPKASWDGTYIEPNVRNENEFGSSIPLGITYILKSDGTQPASGVPAVEESIASEYTYHIVGDRYGRVKGVMSNEFSISLVPDVIACEIPDLYPLIVGDYGELSPDYLYEWELAQGIDAIMDSWRKDTHIYLTSWPAEEEPLALELIGKTIATLTISKKSDNVVLTRVNCVLDSFIYAIEWENHDSVEQEIIFTPGQPVTISLPEDRIASTYDGATLIYMWDRSLGDSYYTITSGAGLTSITFTPEADWDGTWILPYVYREDAPHDAPNLNMIEIEISYILKSSVTSSAQPAPTTQPEASGVSVSGEGNFEYRIDEAGNAVITKYTGIETICNVPETLDGRTVVSIEGNRSKSVFEDCANLQYVLLPDTIQSIGQFAFSKCDSLTGVSLPESLISIGFCAFKDCVSLQDLVFPDAVAFIGSSAFRGCLSLQHVILPKGIKEIAESAFADCANLVSVTCQDSLTIIGYKAFDGCTSLKNLTLSKNLEEIGWAAFRDCRQLNSLALPDRLSTIEYAAFDGCQNLKYLYVPDSVEKIGVGADGTLAFDGETTLICPEGSYAETYAQMYFLTHATGGYSIWNGIVEMAQNMDTSMGTTEAPLEYYTVLTSKRTYLYPGMDEESEAMLRIPGQMLISAVPAGDGWLKTEYAGIPGYVTTNNLKAYDLDKEYTWKEFQTMVNNALKACENGELLVPGPKHVAAYKNGDKAITMPDGVKLIIEGGSFESMLVTNGSIELRGVTVNCARDERCAITVSIPSKERSLELRIDENTTIAATGQYASAIGTDYNNIPSVKNAILNYRIVNNGRIESDGGSGIQIMNWGDSGEAQVYIENNGMILSHWWGGIRCRLCDQQELEIINRGSIESTHQSGIDIETGSFHIANESNAVIKGWASSGAIWAGNSYADATVSGSISNAGELQNLVVQTSVDVLPTIVYEGYDLEVSVWLTQIVRDKDEILSIEVTKEIAKALLRNIKNGSGYAFESAIIDLWTEKRKFESELEYTVTLESNEM